MQSIGTTESTTPVILAVADRADGPLPGACQRLRDLPGHVAVDLDGHTPARRNLWAAQLDDAVRRADAPVLLVAHGVACLAVAWWARLSPASYLAPVHGALFVGPHPAAAEAARLFDSPCTLLPFPSLIARDPDQPESDVHALAVSWGSQWAEGLSLGRFGRRPGEVVWLRGERLLRSLFDAAFPNVAGPIPAGARAAWRPTMIRSRRT